MGLGVIYSYFHTTERAAVGVGGIYSGLRVIWSYFHNTEQFCEMRTKIQARRMRLGRNDDLLHLAKRFGGLYLTKLGILIPVCPTRRVIWTQCVGVIVFPMYTSGGILRCQTLIR